MYRNEKLYWQQMVLKYYNTVPYKLEWLYELRSLKEKVCLKVSLNAPFCILPEDRFRWMQGMSRKVLWKQPSGDVFCFLWAWDQKVLINPIRDQCTCLTVYIPDCFAVLRSIELKAVAAISVLLYSGGEELQVRGPIQISLPLEHNTQLRVSDTIPAWAFNLKTGRNKTLRS